jgi:hypothetical protein
MDQRISSGVPGIHWEKDRKTWRVHIEGANGRIYLGRRKTLDEAIELRKGAEIGVFPTEEEKRARLFDKMARIRMRAVWREATAGDHGWASFDEFVTTVGERPKPQHRLAAKDPESPIGPNNHHWVEAEFDFSTNEGRNAYNRAHRAKNLEMYKDKDLRKKFGISIEEYQAKLSAQNGVCAICFKPERGTRNGKVRWLNVDHNHDTGEVRDLLCTNCNVAVGMLSESEEILRSVISYLDKWNKPDD